MFERRIGRTAMEYDPYARQLATDAEPASSAEITALSTTAILATAAVLLY